MGHGVIGDGLAGVGLGRGGGLRGAYLPDLLVPSPSAMGGGISTAPKLLAAPKRGPARVARALSDVRVALGTRAMSSR